MRTIEIIIVIMLGIIFIASNSYSQNEPEMRLFEINGVPGYLDTASYFKQDHFIIGSMHDAGMYLNRIFLANHQPIVWDYKYYDDWRDGVHFSTVDSAHKLPRGFHIISRPRDWIGGADDDEILLNNPTQMYIHGGIAAAISMKYDAALPIDSSYINNYMPIILPNDSTNEVFGFLNRHQNSDSVNIDGNYYRVFDNNIGASGDELILSDPWTDSTIYFESKSYPDSNLENIFNTKRMYLSIKMRRYNVDSSESGDTVLKIKMPYIYQYYDFQDSNIYTDNRYIRFFKKPQPGNNDYSTLPNYRGKIWNKIPCQQNIYEFSITEEMLKYTDSANGDITYIAEFICNGDE